jgi:hypothetical protein
MAKASRQARTTTHRPAAKTGAAPAAASQRLLWIGLAVVVLLSAGGSGAAFATKDALKPAEIAGTQRVIASLNAEKTALLDEASRDKLPENLLETELQKVSEQLDEANRSLSELTQDRQNG